MIQPVEGIVRAREHIATVGVLLANGTPRTAAREAYLAAFHAAWADVAHRTGKRPKTHAGTRTEFRRLVRELAELPEEFTAFLGRGFEYKLAADCFGTLIVDDDASEASEISERRIAVVERLLTGGDQSA